MNELDLELEVNRDVFAEYLLSDLENINDSDTTFEVEL